MADYLARNRKDWEELDSLVKRTRRWVGDLAPEDLSRLDILYRRTVVHLAQASSRTTDKALIQYLNDLTAAAHSVIYLPPRRRFPTKIGHFLAQDFGRAVARTWRYHAVAAALVALGGVLGYYVSMTDLTAAYAILPAGEMRLAGATREQLEEMLRSGRDKGSGTKFAFSSFLFTNNLRVGLMALATGILAAIPTVILLIFNGMILGAMTAVHHKAGIYGEWWAWVLPHGVTELTAIALAGGVGLMIGRAVISPGLRSRGESLRRAGSESLRVIGGVAIMLVLAAIIESYVRQSNWSNVPRFALAGLTAVFWIGYFALGALLESKARREQQAE